MSSPKVLISTRSFGKADPAPLEELKAAGVQWTLNPHGRTLQIPESIDLLQGACGLIAGTEPLNEEVFSRVPGLKVISRVGTGLNNVDLKAAQQRGILVFNTPEAPSQAVAELAVGLMLSVLRRIAESDRGVRGGKWEACMGALLGDKTVGVVGHGRIGGRVARILRGFGCTVLACDDCEFKAEGVRRVAFAELLKSSHIVTLHVPLSEKTRHLIDAAALAQMRPGAVLINTSRGGLVDEDALAEALRQGRLSGAGIDTFHQEPYGGPLKELPSTVLTAHMGSAAKECRGRMEREAAANLLAGLRQAGVLS
ncbi:MAG TPA: hydroxyacid dehydrogenase [Elusimicrobia bacterium]|nr:hydroxyacid dehydrogenase [Elusimicrobiota bacterium]HBT60125.1 hydroxyacid dehydrogenase [Elusimicrobiota bacterium]